MGVLVKGKALWLLLQFPLKAKKVYCVFGTACGTPLSRYSVNHAKKEVHEMFRLRGGIELPSCSNGRFEPDTQVVSGEILVRFRFSSRWV